MQTHYLPSNPATLTRTLMPEQHIGMMNVHIRVGLALWSGQKDELDDKHVHKCGHHPNYSLKRSAGGEEWEWMKGASMVVVVWGGAISGLLQGDLGAEKPEHRQRRSWG